MSTVLRPYSPPRVQAREPAELLTSEQVASRLAISIRTLWRLIRAAKLPQPVRYNRKLVRWKCADISAYVSDLKRS